MKVGASWTSVVVTIMVVVAVTRSVCVVAVMVVASVNSSVSVDAVSVVVSVNNLVATALSTTVTVSVAVLCSCVRTVTFSLIRLVSLPCRGCQCDDQICRALGKSILTRTSDSYGGRDWSAWFSYISFI